MINVVDLVASGDAVTSAYDRNIARVPETWKTPSSCTSCC